MSKTKKKMGDFKHSDAPDAEGKFTSLSPSALASWLIKTRKGNLSKIISSLNQQIVFNKKKKPSYAAKMKTTQNIVRKRLNKGKTAVTYKSPLEKKDCSCWPGYKRVEGKPPCAPGSCEKSSVKITEEAYERRNRKMRSKHKSETGKTLGSRQTTGKNKRRISFACRFAGMKGSMKKPNGQPTPYAMALKKWGFGSREAAASFCRNNKNKA